MPAPSFLAALLFGGGGGGNPGTFASLLGANLEPSSDGTRARYFNNAVLDSRGFGLQGASPVGAYSKPTTTATFVLSTGSTYTLTLGVAVSVFAGTSADVGKVIFLDPGITFTITAATDTTHFTGTMAGGVPSTLSWASATWGASVSVDANGWPLIASQNVMTATNSAGLDGSLPAGTYYYNYKSTGQAVVATTNGSSGFSITNTQQLGDGLTTRLTLSVASAAVAVMQFSGACWDHDCQRDGSVNAAASSATGLFTNACLAHYSQFSSLRFMDWLFTNSRLETSWASRSPNTTMWRKTWGGSYSWELTAAFANAIKAYPGSKLTQVWFNIPTNATTDYAAQLSSLLQSILSPTLTLHVEVSNEPWNGQFASFTTYGTAATIEAKAVSIFSTSLQAPFGTINSITGDGTNATVTLSGTLPSFITVGANFIMTCQADATGNAGTLATPIQVGSVTSTTFTYPTTKTSFTLSNQYTAYFGLSSNLITDGTSTSANDLTHKYYVRNVYALRQAWIAARPSDHWLLNVSLYGGIQTNACAFVPNEYKYAAFIGGGSAAWLTSVAFAPYIHSSGSNTTTAQIFTTLTTNLNTQNDYYQRSHLYIARSYGLRAIAYEAGPDLQNSPSLMVSAQTDPAMGAFVKAQADKWFQYGCGLFHFFTGGIGPYYNGGDAQGGWSIAQDYNDGSPKLVALANYATPVTYSNSSNHILVPTQYQLLISNGQINATNGMFYWYDKTVLRGLDWAEPFPFDGTYTITIQGSDSVGTASAQIYIDGVLAGSTLLPANGSGSNDASIPGIAPTITTAAVSAGHHNVAVRFAANNGNSPGILNITFALAAAVTPIAPSSLFNLAEGTPTNTTIPLSWSRPTNGTTPITYTVGYRLTSSGGAYTTFATGLTATSTTVTGLANGTYYDFQVTPVNAAGSGTPGVLGNIQTTGILRLAAAVQYFPNTGVQTTSGSRTVAYGEIPFVIANDMDTLQLFNVLAIVGVGDVFTTGNDVQILGYSLFRGDRTGSVKQLTWGGSTTKTLTSGAAGVLCDTIYPADLGYTGYFPAGTMFRFKYQTSVATSGMNMMPDTSKGSGVCVIYNPGTTSMAMSLTNTTVPTNPTGTLGTDYVNNVSGWLPVVVGQFHGGIDPPTHVIIGDSIAFGIGDTSANTPNPSALGERGFITRATVNSGVPTWNSLNFGCSGGTGAAWAQPNASLLLPILKFAKYGWEEYGTNVITASNSTTNYNNAQTQSAYIWSLLKAAGCKVLRTQLFPRKQTTSVANTSVVGSGTLATVTTTSAVVATIGNGTVGATGLRQIAGVTPSGFNGTGITVTVASSTTFTYPNATSGTATVVGVSKDNFVTEVNQLAYGGGNAWDVGGDAVNFSAWCATQVGTLIDYYVPVTAVRGTDVNKWKVDPTVEAKYIVYNDTTHPVNFGALAAATTDVRPVMLTLT